MSDEDSSNDNSFRANSKRVEGGKAAVRKGKTNEGDGSGGRFYGVIRPAARQSSSTDSDSGE